MDLTENFDRKDRLCTMNGIVHKKKDKAGDILEHIFFLEFVSLNFGCASFLTNIYAVFKMHNTHSNEVTHTRNKQCVQSGSSKYVAKKGFYQVVKQNYTIVYYIVKQY